MANALKISAAYAKENLKAYIPRWEVCYLCDGKEVMINTFPNEKKARDYLDVTVKKVDDLTVKFGDTGIYVDPTKVTQICVMSNDDDEPFGYKVVAICDSKVFPVKYFDDIEKAVIYRKNMSSLFGLGGNEDA